MFTYSILLWYKRLNFVLVFHVVNRTLFSKCIPWHYISFMIEDVQNLFFSESVVCRWEECASEDKRSSEFELANKHNHLSSHVSISVSLEGLYPCGCVSRRMCARPCGWLFIYFFFDCVDHGLKQTGENWVFCFWGEKEREKKLRKMRFSSRSRKHHTYYMTFYIRRNE